MLSLKQHQELAKPLRVLRNRWVTILLESSRLFPQNQPVNKAIERVYDLFDRFRSELDNDYCRLVPTGSPFIYYAHDDEAPGVRLSPYLNLDISCQKARLVQITEPLVNCSKTTDRAVVSLAKLLAAISKVEELIAELPPLKKRPSNDMPLPLPWPDGTLPCVRTAAKREGELKPIVSAITDSDLQSIMDSEPLLNSSGFGYGGVCKSKQEQENFLAEHRERLRNDLETCQRVIEWLQANVRHTSKINHRRGSYGLKHIIENDICTYVSNGVMIAAAIHCGFKYQVIPPESLNAFFNMSEVRKPLRQPAVNGTQ